MTTATEEKKPAKHGAAREFRVIVPHTPFRTKNRVIVADGPDEALAAMLDLLRAEHNVLTPAQRKSYGRQQQEWLAERARHPGERPHLCEVLPEDDYQRRVKAHQVREEENRKAVEQYQEEMRNQTGITNRLLAQLPQALAQAVAAALQQQNGPQRGKAG